MAPEPEYGTSWIKSTKCSLWPPWSPCKVIFLWDKLQWKLHWIFPTKGGADGRGVPERDRGAGVQGDRRAHAQAGVVQGREGTPLGRLLRTEGREQHAHHDLQGGPTELISVYLDKDYFLLTTNFKGLRFSIIRLYSSDWIHGQFSTVPNGVYCGKNARI